MKAKLTSFPFSFKYCNFSFSGKNKVRKHEGRFYGEAFISVFSLDKKNRRVMKKQLRKITHVSVY